MEPESRHSCNIFLFLPTAQTKKCDMAFSAFSMIAQIHADSILQTCRATGATEVYICGNVFNSEFMRDRILINKSMMESMFGFVSFERVSIFYVLDNKDHILLL